MAEQDFIDAINANPDDLTTQLVYADWLDERGDSRAEAWRVLIEERHRPERIKHGGWWWPHDSNGPDDFLGATHYHETFFEAMESAIFLYVSFFSEDKVGTDEE